MAFGDGVSLVSDFTGADENPLSEGGNWAILNSSGSPLQRISNAASGTLNTTNYSYWTPVNFGPDIDAYVTVTTLASTFGILVRLQGEGGAGTWDGYRIAANSIQTQIDVVTNNTPTNLLQPGATWASGDTLGARIMGSTIQAWRRRSGFTTWELMVTVSNTTYASAGKIGLFASNTTARLDDFYAGPIVLDSDDPPFGFSGRGAGW